MANDVMSEARAGVDWNSTSSPEGGRREYTRKVLQHSPGGRQEKSGWISWLFQLAIDRRGARERPNVSGAMC